MIAAFSFFKKKQPFLFSHPVFWHYLEMDHRQRKRKREKKRKEANPRLSPPLFSAFQICRFMVCVEEAKKKNQSCSKFEIRSQPPPVVGDPIRSWERKWGKNSNPFSQLYQHRSKSYPRKMYSPARFWRTQVLKWYYFSFRTLSSPNWLSFMYVSAYVKNFWGGIQCEWMAVLGELQSLLCRPRRIACILNSVLDEFQTILAWNGRAFGLKERQPCISSRSLLDQTGREKKKSLKLSFPPTQHTRTLLLPSGHSNKTQFTNFPPRPHSYFPSECCKINETASR